SGNSLPPSLTSSGSSILIRFTTDHSVVAAGWSANYVTNSGGGSKGENVEVSKSRIEVPGISDLIVYPNPTSGLLTVESPDKDEKVYTINLINSSGQVVLNKTYTVIGGKFEIDLSGVSDGFYLLQIRTNLTIQFIRIVKN
ncbi:MAG: T9SS type A sorting domain-containing protein, partial [Bacteroidales bacterium]|nr:T9SS type A sorting domain-containing protein [Bacteroidales bacterium]